MFLTLFYFEISFIGLKEGMHHFDYEVGNEFFDFFDYDEFDRSAVKVALSFLKKATMFELVFDFSGWVELACDLTNELYEHPVTGSLELLVKFGQEFNDEHEEILIIPHAEHRLNVAQYIYEGIVLALPHKRVHPGVSDGTLQSDVLSKLKDFEIENKHKEAPKGTDPRWDKLKDINR